MIKNFIKKENNRAFTPSNLRLLSGSAKPNLTGFTPYRSSTLFYGKPNKKAISPAGFFINKPSFKEKLLTGFTIVELLVVVAIIGLLAAIALISFQSLQARGHDSKRLAEIKTLQDALALYQVQHAQYPIQTDEEQITGTDTMSSLLIESASLKTPIRDPINALIGGVNYIYTYQSTENGETYTIKYCLETDYMQGRNKGCGNEVRP